MQTQFYNTRKRFSSIEHKLKNLPSVYSLTVRIMLLETWQRWIKLTLTSQQVTWPALLTGGINLDHVSLKGEMGIEVHKPSTWLLRNPCANLVRISFQMRKKDSHKISSLRLNQSSSYGFICHIQVVFKFILFNKSKYPHFQLAPSGFNYAKKISGPVCSFEALFPASWIDFLVVQGVLLPD